MNSRLITLKTYILLTLFLSSPLYAQGFYKDLFWDAGVDLDHTLIPVFQTLGVDMEFIRCDSPARQNDLIAGNENDTNGILLYPDNEPRFKVLYTPGGDSRSHGRSLGERGRQRIRTFFKNGGSYVGICGGAAICSLSREAGTLWDDYYHLWPHYVEQVRMVLSPNLVSQKSSDPLQIHEFSDGRIDSIRFTFGSYPDEKAGPLPQGTKILLRYDSPSTPLHEKIGCWSYKKNDQSGTLIATSAHPENDTTGQKLALTEKIFRYALNGTGAPILKGDLRRGEIRRMNKSTEDNDPAFTKIGDLQIHHFRISLENAVNDFKITLRGETGYHLNVYLKLGGFASPFDADYQNVTEGASKILEISKLDAGDWYIGLECASTVGARMNENGVEYVRQLKVLNGIAYTVQAEWKL